MSSTPRAQPRRSALVRELLLCGLCLWMCVASALLLAEKEHPGDHAFIALATVATGIVALLYGSSVARRWRSGERVALSHAGPVMTGFELVIGAWLLTPAITLADHDPLVSSIVGVIGLGLLVSGVLDLWHWTQRKYKAEAGRRRG